MSYKLVLATLKCLDVNFTSFDDSRRYFILFVYLLRRYWIAKLSLVRKCIRSFKDTSVLSEVHVHYMYIVHTHNLKNKYSDNMLDIKSKTELNSSFRMISYFSDGQYLQIIICQVKRYIYISFEFNNKRKCWK